jgi:hypothetical protein
MSAGAPVLFSSTHQNDMKPINQVLLREKKTVQAMIQIYCRGMNHGRARGKDCALCGDLLRYAHERLDKCVFGETKPTCAQCPVHCYQPGRKSEITEVMRYSGPRMILRHPYLAFRHLLAEKKKPSDTVLEYATHKRSRQPL